MSYLKDILSISFFVIMATSFISIAYIIAEFISVAIIILIRWLMKCSIDFSKLRKYLFKSLLIRIIIILVITFLLSTISIVNYNRIIENPDYNRLMYLDKLGAIFKDINNNETVLPEIFLVTFIFGLPLSYILNLIYTGISNTNEKYKKLYYYLVVLNGIILPIGGYAWANMLMGV